MNATAIKSTKSWWPRLIIATFVFFALFIGNMVRQAMQTDVDLVSKDYYKNELAFQDHINQVNATQDLSQQILINHAAAAEQVSLVFPPDINAQNLKGQVQFFRPSNAQLDFQIKLDLNSDKQQHIPIGKLAKGLWRVKLTWQTKNQQYYLQKDITI